MYPRILIAGIRGGAGKTTVTLAILSLLREKGLNVIAFKKGPDYIDSGWLSLFSGNPCYNLDTYMIPPNKVIRSFIERSEGDISVIEGNRGLYDGMDIEGTVATSELAKLLKCPVILVVDCTKITRSVAAIIQGFVNFDRDVYLKGVVLNQVANARHEKIIKESIKRYCNIEIVGSIPRFKDIKMPERHMGLTPHQEQEMKKETEDFIYRVADYLDIEKILKIARDVPPISYINNDTKPYINDEGVKIGVIRDRVFQFYYEENLEELKKYGAEIVLINSLENKALPEIDALYIGGGFPETNIKPLSENVDLIKNIKENAQKGLPVYAECGGLMYLCKSLITHEGEFSMAGIFPFKLKMFKKPQAHGYVMAKVNEDSPFYEKDIEIKGHEFHYSRVIDYDELPHMCFTMLRGEGIVENQDGACFKNTLGTYVHVHAIGCEEWIKGILKIAKNYREIKNA